MPPNADTGARYLTVAHGDELGEEDFRTLETVRRTLLVLMSHGAITELNTYSDHGSTTWSYLPGDEDPGGIMDGLVDMVRTLAPDWPLSRIDSSAAGS